MEEKMIRRSCVDCAVTACERKDGKRPDFCLTTSLNPDLLQEAIAFHNVGKQANRIKCATIGWKAMEELIEESEAKK